MRVRLAIGMLALAAVAIAAGAGGNLLSRQVVNRVDYGTFSLSGPPPRIDWCGRRYYPAAATISMAEADERSLPAPGWSPTPFAQVGTTPSGFAYFARTLTSADRHRFTPPLSCAMAVYLRLESGRFLAYGISGGP